MTTQDFFQRASQVMPGGVNSPVRAFQSVGLEPIFMQSAKGAYLCDIKGKKYIDYVGSWGPMILGHQHPFVVKSMHKVLKKGMSFGTCTTLEVEWAEKICSLVPSLEKVRMVNSGTEATMSAVRLARGFTKRDKIVKFKGCYHGHGDSFLIEAGSGALTHGVPSSPGVTKGTSQDTLICEYNNELMIEEIFSKYANDIAAVILEPIAGNMGVVQAKDSFLKK